MTSKTDESSSSKLFLLQQKMIYRLQISDHSSSLAGVHFAFCQIENAGATTFSDPHIAQVYRYMICKNNVIAFAAGVLGTKTKEQKKKLTKE